MINNLVAKLADKSISKDELFEKVKQDFGLLPSIIEGASSGKAAIRYGCGKVLMNISEQFPEKLYAYMDSIILMLDSKYRISIWQAMFIIANLTKVDKDKKFDDIFDKYFNFITSEYMVSVANVVGHSGKIALAKPYLIPKITKELLKVDTIHTTPHLTEECKKVIAEHAIQSLDMFFSQIENKNEVISFVEKYTNSTRKKLKIKSVEFLKKWKISPENCKN
jgi:hypothetical protein